jgi:hypothetical protein
MPYSIFKIQGGYVVGKTDGSKFFSNHPMTLLNAKKQLKAIGMSGGDKKRLNLLEMFKGTGSVGKVAIKSGYDVISIDFDPIYDPHIETDILDWDYKKYHKETGYIPDFIWASPPCNTFSPLAYPLQERNPQTAEPYKFSKRAVDGTKILYKTLDIIKYFKKLNPDLKFCIENPKGMMRKDKMMKKLHMETTLYCLYGDIKRKPTDFWSNFNMNLLPTDTKYTTKTISVVDLPLDKRYSIPSKLIKQILMQSHTENTLKGLGRHYQYTI